jgi:hypothetical protein
MIGPHRKLFRLLAGGTQSEGLGGCIGKPGVRRRPSMERMISAAQSAKKLTNAKTRSREDKTLAWRLCAFAFDLNSSGAGVMA